jgi:hypothetical protein
MLNKPTSVLNKWTCLARALGVITFGIVEDTIFVVLLKVDLDVQQTYLRFLILNVVVSKAAPKH